ncbi:MAG TPA: hypothetical protein RMH85_27840 [Polyangiaceae bacterium LLY-WYZ-15_(1-7)]|nr:hypothetical protein [Myxococcales bacterium]MBJ71409.1 hypothetical protein [Sandaracinus sp.]HJK91191.1 hypothetical protein [Polyangiaceae bacterium LLY-WYZ-15_(1-7)]HJL06453.1 hypothetical protein [Polyangiaceae bacterium LLY-WYZ-15_(1-7)]HJL12323.1 hypothetical protein [Polyangiaceae bacterium LLY-WYZ-15_(1-7)]
MLRHFPITLALITSLAACGDSGEGAAILATAEKGTHGAAAHGELVAFLDGAEASTDPTRVGVDVCVVDAAGAERLRAPSLGGVRGLALLPDAVATLELEASFADQRVVIRPFDGEAVVAAHEDVPIALVATDEGLLWVEAAAVEVDTRDVPAEAEVRLTLVEADPRGVVRSRTAVGGEPIRTNWALLSPHPKPFGLRLEGDTLTFGWDGSASATGTELYAIARDTGEATLLWRGCGSYPGGVEAPDCGCGGDAPRARQVAEGLALFEGAPLVVGADSPCGAAEERALLMHGETAFEHEVPLRHVAAGPEAALVAGARQLFRFDGDGLEALDVAIEGRVTGLARGDAGWIVVTDEAVLELPFGAL